MKILIAGCGDIGTALGEVLSRKLQRGFHRLRTSGHEIDTIDTRRRRANKLVGKGFQRLRGEKCGMRVRNCVKLILDGLYHFVEPDALLSVAHRSGNRQSVARQQSRRGGSDLNEPGVSDCRWKPAVS